MVFRAKVLSALVLWRQKVSYGGTIGLLILILWAGHRTHWNPFGKHDVAQAAHASLHGKITTAKPQSAGGEIKEVEADDVLLVSDAALAKAGVQLGRVERRAMTTSLTASGVVAYNHNLRAELATRVPGNVWRIEKHVGETIHQGDVLAIIEATEVGRAKGELLQAIVQSELRAINFERVRQLGGGVAERQVREAEAAARQAQIHAQVCVQALVNLGLPLALAELDGLSDQDRARRIQFAGLPKAVVESLDPRTTTANLLLAPFAGVVIGRDSAIGELVSPDQPHFEIADIRKVWVLLEVRKEDVNQVRLGQTVTFTPDGYGGEVAGQVDWISTQLDEKTRTLQVRAEVDNPDCSQPAEKHATFLLRARTYGTGRILLRDLPDALVVSVDAVQLDRGRNFVFVREQGRFRRCLVEVGARQQNLVEIVSGLEEGLTIATAGSHVLKAEMQIVAATR
jgi:cobalt-zinc-cadmium efflux system membrane fusion protein